MARVDRIQKFANNPTTLMGFVGKHYAILNDFDPETMEVLIFAKDARRLWVENDGSEYVHSVKPTWCGGLWCFDGGSASYLEAAVVGVGGQDLVEFVAVATHRPPEPVKVVPPKAVPDDIDGKYAAWNDAMNNTESSKQVSLWHSEWVHQ
jgi:hypothetical protein